MKEDLEDVLIESIKLGAIFYLISIFLGFEVAVVIGLVHTWNSDKKVVKMKHYKYTLQHDVKLKLSCIPKYVTLSTKWFDLVNGELTVYKGYSWDGCSPKFVLFGKEFGTWDGKKDKHGEEPCKYPSLAHDVMYQFLSYFNFKGVTRKMIDDEFRARMKAAGFKLANVYYLGVRLFGGIFNKYF